MNPRLKGRPHGTGKIFREVTDMSRGSRTRLTPLAGLGRISTFRRATLGVLSLPFILGMRREGRRQARETRAGTARRESDVSHALRGA